MSRAVRAIHAAESSRFSGGGGNDPICPGRCEHANSVVVTIPHKNPALGIHGNSNRTPKPGGTVRAVRTTRTAWQTCQRADHPICSKRRELPDRVAAIISYKKVSIWIRSHTHGCPKAAGAICAIGAAPPGAARNSPPIVNLGVKQSHRPENHHESKIG